MKAIPSNSEDIDATILAVNEATHYLVGLEDPQGNFIPLPNFDHVIPCDSLTNAKQLLKDCDIHAAKLTLQTAYDEMCGLPSSGTATEIITF
ncbi:MAG: hypothetical protein HWE10_00415 [Gammaproteobacteria bacterium]|nr:hypothetical protein [Gammaproteobacteria bacterium]